VIRCLDSSLTCNAFALQAQKYAKATNEKMPKSPRQRSSRRNGLVSELNLHVDGICNASCSADAPSAKQRKCSEKGGDIKSFSPCFESDDGEVLEGLRLACSGVPEEVLDRCRRAVSKLGNATMVNTEEEAMNTNLTHLVLGSTKCSGKLLLALASGAVVVRPDWLVQSIRWRRWVPTKEFLFEVRGSKSRKSHGFIRV
jgi:hypothetical protein